jgi:hypothetical protein
VEVETIHETRGSKKLLVQSIQDVLVHPKPPLSLVEKVKDYARATQLAEDSQHTPQVMLVIYYACIAVGLIRYGKRIAKMSDDEMLASFRWAGQQPWIEPRVAALLQEAATLLSSGCKKI